MNKPLIIRRPNNRNMPTGAMQSDSDSSQQAEVIPMHSDDDVLVSVPKTFTLTDDDHAPHKYAVGTYNMPRSHAMHWYAKANGVAVANISNPNA